MRKNIHRSKPVNQRWVNKKVKSFFKYPTPKYIEFIDEMLNHGYEVKLLEVKVSKYIFVCKDEVWTKVRFSNHRPNKWREKEEDCDYFVGISHFQVSTWKQVVSKVLKDG